MKIERLTGLVAFTRSASLGSFSAAARALAVSPSAVSKSIQRLEQDLGVKLFSRTTRSLALTSEGRDLYERALRVLREIDEIEQVALASRSEPSGVLRVTAPLPIGLHLLAPILPLLREQYPNLTIDLRLTDRFVDLIDEGLDIAVRVGELRDSRLIARPLAPHRVGAFASPAYLARKGTPRHLEDLAQHDCVNFRFQNSGQALQWPFKVAERIQEISPPSVITADSSDVVASILVAGGGIGISPTYVAAGHVRRGDLVPVLPQCAMDRSEITALWPESRSASPNVKAFMKFLRERFVAPTPWDATVKAAYEDPH